MTNVILDTPDQIEAYRILATYHGLRMEIEMPKKHPGLCTPASLPTRGRALASARRLIAQYKLPGPRRTRAQALATLQPLYEHLTNKEQ